MKAVPRLRYDKTRTADTHFDPAVLPTLNGIGRRVSQAVGLPEFTRDSLVKRRHIFQARGNQNAATRDFRDLQHPLPGCQNVIGTHVGLRMPLRR